MGLFGKKKSAPVSPQQPPPIQHQPAQSVPYLGLQTHWNNVEQRPNTSQGAGQVQLQSQDWLTVPQYQPVYAPQSQISPQPQHKSSKSDGAISKLKLSSMTDLLSSNVPQHIPGARMFNDGTTALHMQTTQYLNQAAALMDQISSKFDAVITMIDGERFSGDERELAMFVSPPMWQQQQEESGYSERGLSKGKSKGMVNNSVSSALTTTNYFAKASLYANSRLSPNFPPLKLYIPTFPLLCLAAQYSERVYTKPSGQEKETHVDADWRQGTKAMVLKSVPMDDMNTIVFAIRGTSTFLDWSVNLNSAPASPDGFLDDPGNFCHAGFLTVAKKMIKPVAARLRHLLQEDPGRSKCSLLITGHSAGGAIASLLYSHMLSTSKEAESELNILTGCFKRIHCINFGAPPVSLLPLTRPSNPALRKSIFLSFVNEGDPVTRADKTYVRSLLDLYASPAPGQSCIVSAASDKLQPLVAGLGKSVSSLHINKIRPSAKKANSAPTTLPYWQVPEATLSNAGRIVLLRSVERYESSPGKKKGIQERMNEGVVAQTISDELLRGVIFGDPNSHQMRLYARRIEILATNAVMGRS